MPAATYVDINCNQLEYRFHPHAISFECPKMAVCRGWPMLNNNR
jgi:hypothetical protein